MRDPTLPRQTRFLVIATITAITVGLTLMALAGLCRWPAAVPRMDHDGIFPRLAWTSATGLQVTAAYGPR